MAQSRSRWNFKRGQPKKTINLDFIMREKQIYTGTFILTGGIIVGLILGRYVWQGHLLATASTPSSTSASTPVPDSKSARRVLYWANPMDPEVHSDHAMKDGMGMAYVPVYASGGSETKVSGLSVDPRMTQTLGVRLATVQMRRMGHTVHSVGTVAVDDNRTYMITSRFTGWIKQLNVRAVGDKIHKNEVLAEIYSPQIFSAEQEYLIALHQSGGAGGAELVEASRNRLRRFGMPPTVFSTLRRTGRPLRDVPIVAPEDGVVTALKVRQGGYVDSGSTLYEIANLDRVWMNVALYSYQLPWANIGDPVKLESPDYPGKVWNARLQFLYPTLDPTTRTVTARVSIANPGDVLRPGMYANATLTAGTKPELAIPSAAILRTDDGDYAMIAQSHGHFLPVELALGPDSDGWTAVTKGLNPGDKVVDNAQFLLYSESQFQNVKARMIGGDVPAKSSMSMPSVSQKQAVRVTTGEVAGERVTRGDAAP